MSGEFNPEERADYATAACRLKGVAAVASYEDKLVVLRDPRGKALDVLLAGPEVSTREYRYEAQRAIEELRRRRSRL